MRENSTPGDTRLKLESRAFFGVLVFVAVIAAGIECVERWRYGGQSASVGESSPPQGTPCTPPPFSLPPAARAFRSLADTASGACLLRYESAAPPTAEVTRLLEQANAPACDHLTQYWRLDTDFWCARDDGARGGCRGSLCVWRAADGDAWFARWQMIPPTSPP